MSSNTGVTSKGSSAEFKQDTISTFTFPKSAGHLAVYLMVLLMMLIISGSVNRAWAETVDHLLGKETGWDRIGAHWGFTSLTVAIFLVLGFTLSRIEERKRQEKRALQDQTGGRVSDSLTDQGTKSLLHHRHNLAQVVSGVAGVSLSGLSHELNTLMSTTGGQMSTFSPAMAPAPVGSHFSSGPGQRGAGQGTLSGARTGSRFGRGGQSTSNVGYSF
ncbi:MAG: hypothetical protein JKY23_06050 [Nitrospinaceae bacterium]|nr:hypothetical protein [Nitrospinaceae bacterium]